MQLKASMRGDTVIEVLFAITVFSFIAIGGMSLMNKGTAMAQQALEIGLVRQQMDTQADALRYLSRAYAIDYGKNGPATELWRKVVEDNAIRAEDGSAADFDTTTDGKKCNIPSGAFALNVRNLFSGEVLRPTNEVTTYARISYDDVPDMLPPPRAEGIWIQAVRSKIQRTADGQIKPGFYDFHIRACWHSPGQESPVTLGTIVRLYEPRQ